MAAASASSGPNNGSHTNPTGPPKTGYAVQYERLLMEEISLQKARKDFLKSEHPPTVAADANDGGIRKHGTEQVRNYNKDKIDEICNLKVRGMLHRASLNGMLMAGQYASDQVKSNPSGDFEQGLECEESRHALAALWSMKSMQLERDDLEIPNVFGLSSMDWTHRYYSEIRRKNSSSDAEGTDDMMEANADDFFNAFPECARDNFSCQSESDESGDEVEIVECKKPKPTISRENADNAIAVTSCASSSPSPERPFEKPKEISNKVDILDTKSHLPSLNQQNQQQHQRPHSNMNTSHPSPRDGVGQPRDYSAQWDDRNPSNRNIENPYNRKNQNKNHQHGQFHNENQPSDHAHPQARGPQHNQWQNNAKPNPYQQQKPSFEYGDNNSNQNTNNNDRANLSAKPNPFRTAKELGKNFNSDAQDHGGPDDDDWDNHNNHNKKRRPNNSLARSMGNNNCSPADGYNGVDGGSNTHRRMIGANQSTSAPGPQQLVRAAIRGPKENLSAGLQKKFKPPMKRDGVGGNGSTNKNHSSTNRPSGGTSTGNGDVDDDEELPEELRGLDKKLVERIYNEIVDRGDTITFDDIAGLSHAKQTIRELIIMPMLRPDLFTGLRACPNGE